MEYCFKAKGAASEKTDWSYTFVKYNRNVPDDFMSNNVEAVNSLIMELNSEICNQKSVDEIYEKFCKMVKCEMNAKMEHKTVQLDCQGNFKKKVKRNKPWWSDDLSVKWRDLRSAEKRWHASRGALKQKLKAEMVKAKNVFDKEVQKCKRKYWYLQQQQLSEMCNNNQPMFWKNIGKVGIVNEKRRLIPCEVVKESGEVSVAKSDVLDKWKCGFSTLLNPTHIPHHVETNYREKVVHNSDILDQEITINDIITALRKSKKGKATGVDEIPVEVLCNENCMQFLCDLFNACFQSGVFPEMWKMGVISPVPKSNMTDPRDPSYYRGITLAVSSYKLFCSILNHRLQEWADLNDLIAEEQNGFRKERSSVDQLLTLVNIVESRIKCKQNTFAAFIDFKKAYDLVNRDLLWNKLRSLGMEQNSKILNALQGIYNNVKCCVKVNGITTDWFNVSTGLRQGCLLSPLLFNLYINDLVNVIKQSCTGIPIGGENVCILMYADDLVLLARNERDLQNMLDVLAHWCQQWNVKVNAEKTEIVHFRKNGVEVTNVNFKIGESFLKTVSEYKYLGLILNEFLDYKITANNVAKSASRALGLLIAKSKALGGIPYDCFRKLYECLVLPVIHYGSAVWGHSQFSSINAVHNRACRYFLGVGKYTPNAAVQGDTGLPPPEIDQWITITRQWCRLLNMNNNRLNKTIFIWAHKLASTKCKNWVWKTIAFYKKYNLVNLTCVNNNIDRGYAIEQVSQVAYQCFVQKWCNVVNMNVGKNGAGKKLRTYRQIKQTFEPEPYVVFTLNRKHRSAVAKLRCGVAPIRIETGRYEGLPVWQRLCPFCENCIETEVHVLTQCSLYVDLRNELYEFIGSFEPQLYCMSDDQKFQMIMSSTNKETVLFLAKICSQILERRKCFNHK
jgi:hypothetical protein